MNPQIFQSTVQKSGKRIFIPIPFNPNEVWGEKARHHVRGTVNDCAIRGPLSSEGDQFFLQLNPSWNRDASIKPGATVQVTLAPDIAAALDAEPEALTFFESLASFYRNTYVKWIESAKRPETRNARIQEMVTLLKAGKKQK